MLHVLLVMIIWSVGRQATGEFQEVKVFATSTVEVCMSIDNRLFCASEDGTMIMFEMHIPGPQRTARANTNTLPWCSQVLISRVDLQDCINRAQELETKVSPATWILFSTTQETCFRMIVFQK